MKRQGSSDPGQAAASSPEAPSDMAQPTFGERMRTARHDTGLTAGAFAEKLGVTETIVRGWEGGDLHPGTDQIDHIVGLLDVSTPWLLEGRDDAFAAGKYGDVILAGAVPPVSAETDRGAFASENKIAVHHEIVDGVPVQTVKLLLDNVSALKDPDVFQKATGMSMRTYHRKNVSDRLTPAQGERTLRFRGVHEKAAEVFGSGEAATDWLLSPVLALDGERPVDLLETDVGARSVEDVLTRMEYGVYT